ncbi:MAG: hypothetical protein IJ563_03930 [Selenomonadaceae bacterium]|nr:hypothetical protein [Selenomonadaceae bacterium]
MEQARVINRVIKFQIYPNEEQAQSLSDNMLEYCRVCNFVSQWVFDNDFVFSHKRINDALYYKLVHKFNQWFIHISATREIADYVKENTQMLVGIDRGLRFITVIYDCNL